jgi:hypothetical protein
MATCYVSRGNEENEIEVENDQLFVGVFVFMVGSAESLPVMARKLYLIKLFGGDLPVIISHSEPQRIQSIEDLIPKIILFTEIGYGHPVGGWRR